MLKILLLLLVSNQAFSQVTPKVVEKPWKFSGSLGGSFSWTATQNFVGVSSNNPSVTPSLHSHLDLKYREDVHEWRNNLNIILGYTYFPPPSAWIKTSDTLKINTIYLYHQLPWFGYFGSVSLKTSIFPGESIEGGSNTYLITDVVTNKKAGEVTATSLHLSNAFAPLFLEQWAGVFAQFVDKPEVFLELRLGAAVRENFGHGQKAITCNGPCNANSILVQQLANVYELGPGAGILFKTQFWNNKLSYRLDFDTIWAILQTPEIKPTGSWSRFSFDLSSTLGFNLLSWLTLNWTLKALQNPAVIDNVQYLSNLSLAINFPI